MGDMHEIVDAAAFGRFLLLAGCVGPVAGAIVGGAIGWRTGSALTGAIRGFIVGLVFPLIWLLWKMYNSITDRLGLDTVRNFFVNIALFLLIGLGIGLGLRWAERRASDPR